MIVQKGQNIRLKEDIKVQLSRECLPSFAATDFILDTLSSETNKNRITTLPTVLFLSMYTNE